MSLASVPGRIYLADQRGLTQTAQQQRHSTFSFGPYAAEDRAPFGRLLACNEELLAPGQTVALPAPAAASYLLALPVTGAVEVAGELADVGQVLVLPVPAGAPVELRNPYPDDVIALLHLWVAAPDGVVPAATRPFGYELAGLHNQLAELVPWAAGLPFALRLGRFQGRREAVLRPAAGQLFAFVLAGAFELEGRLLHAKDGLALWACEAAELEALSNDALVLVVELA